LQAVYTTQYRFTIKDFADNSVYESWYDSWSTAKFVQPDKVKNTVPMDGFLGALGGLWRLQVWLDNGQPISPDSDITVNEPHTLAPRYSPDYTMPMAIVGAILAAIVLSGAAIVYLGKRRKSSSNKQAE